MQIVLGSGLLGLCSLLQIFVLISLTRFLRRHADHLGALSARLRWTTLLILSFGAVVFAHTIQVWLWAISFVWLGALPGFSEAIYFSLVTYTTVGYGDVTVGEGFRVFGAMASVTGLLNFGLSTAFLVGLFAEILKEGND